MKLPALSSLLLGLFLAPALAASGAGADGATDLLSLTRDALINDPGFAAARFAQLASAEATAQARSNLLPVLSASLSEAAQRLDYRVADISSSNLEKTFNAWGPALNLTMPIYNAQFWDSLTQAKLSVAQSEAQLAQARADLLVRVAQAYFDVLTSTDALAALRENQKAVAEQLAQAQREFEVGTKTIVDTHEAKARYDQIDAQEQVARGDLAIKQSALRAIIGHDAGAIRALRDPIVLVLPQPQDVESWARDAASVNFSVLAARAGAQIARYEIRRARDAYLPTLNLTGSVSYQRSDNGSLYIPVNNAQTSSQLGITLTVPLYSGGLLQSKLREAHARADKAEQELELAQRTAALAARQAYSGVDFGLAQVQALESAEVSAKTQLESTRLGYQVGVRINLDLLNANTQLFNTQRDLKKARYDFLVNGLKLKAAAGALADADLEAVNALLAR